MRGRLIRNLSHLAGGKAASAGIGVVSLALTARLLGPAAFGVVALIESYCRLIDQVLRLETWQSIIRYGTEPALADDRGRLARLIKLGILVDIVGALLVAAVAVAAVPLAARFFGWNDEAQGLARLYAIALLFGISSTPVGVLRLFGKFAEMAWIDPALALLRVAGLVAISAGGGGLRAVVILLVILVVAERVAMSALAWRTLRAANIGGIARAPLAGWRADFPEIAGFLVSTNASVLLRKVTQETDTLAVGYFAGAAGAGVYQFARRIMLTVAKTAQTLQQVVTPDLAKLWAAHEHDRFARLVRRIEGATVAVAVAALLTLLIGGETLVTAIGGAAFAGAYVPMITYAVAVALFLAGTTLRSGLMVSGHQSTVLRSSIVATIAYLVVLVPSIKLFGPSGAGVAQIVFSAIVLAMTARSFRSMVVRNRQSRPLI